MAANTDRPLLCAKGCGFYGSTETKNLCSKCYMDLLKDGVSKPETKLIKAPISTGPNPSVSVDSSSPVSDSSTLKTNRCQCCNKKVGLMGFSCRCGKVFCGVDRYPKEHSCNFDFKTADRLILAKENPVMKADKLQSRI